MGKTKRVHWCNYCQVRLDRYQAKMGVCPLLVEDKNGKTVQCGHSLSFIRVCLDCDMPVAAQYTSSSRLLRYETADSMDLDLNKANFEYDRHQSFCNPDTCGETGSLNGFKIDAISLVYDANGGIVSKNKLRKFLRYGIGV